MHLPIPGHHAPCPIWLVIAEFSNRRENNNPGDYIRSARPPAVFLGRAHHICSLGRHFPGLSSPPSGRLWTPLAALRLLLRCLLQAISHWCRAALSFCGAVTGQVSPLRLGPGPARPFYDTLRRVILRWVARDRACGRIWWQVALGTSTSVSPETLPWPRHPQ